MQVRIGIFDVEELLIYSWAHILRHCCPVNSKSVISTEAIAKWFVISTAGTPTWT